MKTRGNKIVENKLITDTIQVVAGAVVNYVLTSDASGNGTWQASSGLTVTTPTGTVNSVNQTFTVTSTPKWIVSDGIIYFSGAGYSIVGLTVTMDLAPTSYIRAII